MYTLKILQNMSKDMFNSTILIFKNKSYLFNVSDGTQRNAVDQCIKINKINEVFFSSSNIDNYTGIFGLLMSRNEMIPDLINYYNILKFNFKENISQKDIKIINTNQRRINIYSPLGFKNNFNNINNFFKSTIQNDIYEYNNATKEFVKEDKFSIEYNVDLINLINKYILSTNKTNSDRIDLVDKIQSSKLNLSISSKIDKKSYFEDENLKIYTIETNGSKQCKKNNKALNYFILPNKKKRSFIAEKAKSLGLKPGIKYSQLSNNLSVLNDEGIEIRPYDVLSDLVSSAGIAYLYSPTIENGIELANYFLENNSCNNIAELVKVLKNNKNANLTEVNNNYKNNNESGNLKISDYNYIAYAIHIVDDIQIISNTIYKNFILNSFGSDTIHIIDCKETNKKYLLNKHKLNTKYVLNKINNNLFKCNISEEQNKEILLFNLSDEDIKLSNILTHNIENNNIIRCNSGMEFMLSSKDKLSLISTELYKPFYYSSPEFLNFKINVDNIINNYFIKNPSYATLLKNSLDNKTNSKFIGDPNITFLGTISMKPGSHRNVSSILVSIKNNNLNYLLLDCGEGTYQQIYSHYSENKCNEIIKNLNVVFITHKHGDHMLGLPKILKEKDNILNCLKSNKKSICLLDNILYLILPKNTIEWFQNLIKTLDNSDYFKIIDCQSLNPNESELYYHKFINQKDPYFNFSDCENLAELNKLVIIDQKLVNFKNKINRNTTINANNICVSNNIYSLNNNLFIKAKLDYDIEVKEFYNYINNYLNLELFSIEVFHCDDSFGCILYNYKNLNNSKDKNWKISYSGDTRPCNNFLNYSKESTVLIHEATLDDELAEDAKDKLHSCFTEGINIGKQNNSYRTILTHFSPRYIKLSPWQTNFETNKILVANDYMTLNLNDLENSYLYSKEAYEVLELLKDII